MTTCALVLHVHLIGACVSLQSHLPTKLDWHEQYSVFRRFHRSVGTGIVLTMVLSVLEKCKGTTLFLAVAYIMLTNPKSW